MINHPNHTCDQSFPRTSDQYLLMAETQPARPGISALTSHHADHISILSPFLSGDSILHITQNALQGKVQSAIYNPVCFPPGTRGLERRPVSALGLHVHVCARVWNKVMMMSLVARGNGNDSFQKWLSASLKCGKPHRRIDLHSRACEH